MEAHKVVEPKDLLGLSSQVLFEKFGKGEHIPGSGSATAFQGMLAAELLITVIKLTLDEEHIKNYKDYVVELSAINEDLKNNLIPSLNSLFVIDSEQFNRVIELRRKRNKVFQIDEKQKIIHELEEATILATHTPIQIAEICLEIGNHGIFCIKNAFQSARGDSSVAINICTAAISGAISIVDLNLLSISNVNKLNEFSNLRNKIYNDNLDLVQQSVESSLKLKDEAIKHIIITKDINTKLDDILANTNLTHDKIESETQWLQNYLWKERKYFFKGTKEIKPIGVLNPSKVLSKALGYQVGLADTLGIYDFEGDKFEVAGYIDKNKKIVKVSNGFSLETQNFTLAHELGHAILHRGIVMHRDRPVDGSTSVKRDKVELQADKFAAYFLMPRKLVIETFIDFFETKVFKINQEAVFKLNAGSIKALIDQCDNKRGLSRLVASTNFYGIKNFMPLYKIFKVSVETMAIRLEELDLIEFNKI